MKNEGTRWADTGTFSNENLGESNTDFSPFSGIRDLHFFTESDLIEVERILERGDDMTNVPVTSNEEPLSLFDKHLPNMDCGYLRQILPYDHERYEIEEECKYGLFSLSGNIILSGESAADIFNELKDKHCAIFWVN